MIDDTPALIWRGLHTHANTQIQQTQPCQDCELAQYFSVHLYYECASPPPPATSPKTSPAQISEDLSTSPACSYKTNICTEALACYSNKYITLIMRRYPNLPRRGFKEPVRDVSDCVTRLRDETTHRSHARAFGRSLL